MDKEVDIYTTVQGDMWDSISFKVYEEDKYSKELTRANPKYANIAIFSGGIDLICPDISNIDSSTTPPWR
ncbi:tail protein X [Psychrilyobacter sp.]|uniref:tail protein X n=1 Tax=Psychrilyobacter sp. TaxID=2586924 RepID=UPI00301B4181